MKKLILSAAVFIATMCAFAQWNIKSVTDSLPYGTTNSFMVDASQSKDVSLQVALTGAGAHTTTATIGITNAANIANASTLTVTLGSTASVYTWTNNPVSSVTNLSSPYTNILITLTNIAGATNGATLVVSLNARTNTFTWADVPSAITDVQTNSNTGLCGTALYNALSAVYPAYIMSQPASNSINFRAASRDNLIVTQSGGWGNSVSSTVNAVTNIVSTNLLLLQLTNSAAYSTTNLYTALATDYAASLIVSYASPASLTLVTKLNPGLGVAQSSGYATNLCVTNAIIGGVNLVGSNSLDRVTWFRDATKDLTVTYSTTALVSYLTNWQAVPAPYYAWSVENATTNYAAAGGIVIQAATRK